MEDNEIQDVSERYYNRFEETTYRPGDVNEVVRVEKQQDENFREECPKRKHHPPEKTIRNTRSKEINSKSDSWFIITRNYQQNGKIIPSNCNQNLLFSCGDVEAFSTNYRKICLSDQDLWKTLKPCSEYERKLVELKKFLEINLEVADLKINLYISACNKHCLSPYPNYIIEESAVGLASLMLVNDFIPPVGLLHHYLTRRKTFLPNEHVINVLHWLLITFPDPNVSRIDQSSFKKVISKVEFLTNVKLPAHMFILKSRKTSEGFWMSVKKNMETKFAFLPINIEHAHSVLHLGIHPQIFTEGVHGNGIYLTTDLGCILENRLAQWVWGKSMLGIETQVIFLVEFINHPSIITFTEKKAICTKFNVMDLSDKFGRTYFIPSHKFIKVRYLMLYVKTPPAINVEQTKPEINNEKCNILRNKFTPFCVTILIAAILLIGRRKFTGFAKKLFSSISTFPLIKHCLTNVN